MRTMAVRHKGTEARRCGGFTLTELMVAIAVLVGVLLATSKIFSTTSKVTAMGQATSDLMQEAAAIERQLRADIARLSHEGFFAIRNVAVANDINLPFGYGLLDPTRDRDAVIRADQLVFFASGVQGAQTYRQKNPGENITIGSNRKGRGTISRIYFGHGFQLGQDALPAFDKSPPNGVWYAYDANQTVLPWTVGTVEMTETKFVGPQIFSRGSSEIAMNLPQIDARRWLLARQNVVMVDDRDLGIADKTVYLGQTITAPSLRLYDPELNFWSTQIRDGRIDAAATQLNDLRRLIKYQNTGSEFAWSDGQYPFIMNWDNGFVYYPRVERTAPSMHRIDQALTNNIIGTACSSIKIDWTWSNGTGYWWPAGASNYTAVEIPTSIEQPWFGIVDPERGVYPFDIFNNWISGNPIAYADTIFPINIEQYDTELPGEAPLVVYNALFGFNQDSPLVEDRTDPNFGEPMPYVAYTPWPSAIRVTVTLHDANTTLEGGREFQFIIDLPKRATEFYQKWCGCS